MLKKLFVYDMKALSKLLIIVHIPLILLALILRFTVVDALGDMESKVNFTFTAGFFIFLFFAYLVVVAFVTEIYFAYYTYKNLFSEQGYLTLTLPATPGQQIGAKLLSGSIWILIDQVVIIGSCFLCAAGTQAFATIADKLDKLPDNFFQLLFGMSFPLFILFCILSVLVGAITTPCTIIGVICIGQLSNKNRVLISIVAYFVYYFFIQLISSGFMGYQIGSISTSKIFVGTPYETASLPYMKELLLLSMLFSALFGIIAYLFSIWFMRKKINLH